MSLEMRTTSASSLSYASHIFGGLTSGAVFEPDVVFSGTVALTAPGLGVLGMIGSMYEREREGDEDVKSASRDIRYDGVCVERVLFISKRRTRRCDLQYLGQVRTNRRR